MSNICFGKLSTAIKSGCTCCSTLSDKVSSAISIAAPQPHSPMNRAAIVFMISLVPAKIRVTRMSRQARAIGYSSQ